MAIKYCSIFIYLSSKKPRAILIDMNRKVIGVVAGIIVSIALAALFIISQKNTSLKVSPKQEATMTQFPSATLKQYVNPTGFTFNYPDNLSLLNNDPKDNSTYADIQLSAKQMDGKINIKIKDSKFLSAAQFFKETASGSASPQDVKLGTLPASELKEKDKTRLAAVDQGILFTIEVLPAGKSDYWANVYSAILTSFSFSSQAQNAPATQDVEDTSDSVSFEGEETVE